MMKSLKVLKTENKGAVLTSEQSKVLKGGGVVEGIDNLESDID